MITQTWHDLLFAHWPIDPDRLRRVVPPMLPLDLFDGQAWVGVVPFSMTNVSPRGIVVPWLSAFAELNVRTYVTLRGKPGVYFFSLDAASTLAVIGARAMFDLPYYRATMTVHAGPHGVSYRSARRGGGAEFAASYGPIGPVMEAQVGTLEYFLTERYCLYTVSRAGEPRRLDIHHRPWPLQPADAQIAVNTMAQAAKVTLTGGPPLMHFAKRMDVLTWGMETAV
jgi:uncharacterized protein